MTTKRRKRHTPEQIVRKLRDVEAMLNSGRDEVAVLQALENENKHLKDLASGKAESAATPAKTPWCRDQ